MPSPKKESNLNKWIMFRVYVLNFRWCIYEENGRQWRWSSDDIFVQIVLLERFREYSLGIPEVGGFLPMISLEDNFNLWDFRVIVSLKECLWNWHIRSKSSILLPKKVSANRIMLLGAGFFQAGSDVASMASSQLPGACSQTFCEDQVGSSWLVVSSGKPKKFAWPQ